MESSDSSSETIGVDEAAESIDKLPGSSATNDNNTPPPSYQDNATAVVPMASDGTNSSSTGNNISNNNGNSNNCQTLQRTRPVSPQSVMVSLATGDRHQPAEGTYYLPQSTSATLVRGYTFNTGPSNQQQLVPIVTPATVVYPSGGVEPAEAVVARTLSILSIFCCFQVWFSIPAIIFAYRRNKKKQVYQTSIALSLTAIVLGIVGAGVMMIFGIILPVPSAWSDYYYPNEDYYPTN